MGAVRSIIKPNPERPPVEIAGCILVGRVLVRKSWVIQYLARWCILVATRCTGTRASIKEVVVLQYRLLAFHTIYPMFLLALQTRSSSHRILLGLHPMRPYSPRLPRPVFTIFLTSASPPYNNSELATRPAGMHLFFLHQDAAAAVFCKRPWKLSCHQLTYSTRPLAAHASSNTKQVSWGHPR